MEYNVLMKLGTFEAQKAAGAYQGWGDTEARADFTATGGQDTGGGGGNEFINPADIPSSLDFVMEQEKPIEEAFKEYAMTVRGQKPPLDIYQELETAAGLPQQKKIASTLREQIGSLEDTIRRVEPQVQATTKQSLVTQGQQEGMIAERRRPLMENLGTLGTALGRITQGISATIADLGTKAGLVFKGQEQQLEPLKMRLSLMQDRAARFISGFNSDKETRLSLLLDEVSRNRQLNDMDRTEAFELIKLENSYNRELSKLQKQSELDLALYTGKKEADKKYGTTGTTDWTQYFTDNNVDISSLW